MIRWFSVDHCELGGTSTSEGMPLVEFGIESDTEHLEDTRSVNKLSILILILKRTQRNETQIPTGALDGMWPYAQEVHQHRTCLS